MFPIKFIKVKDPKDLEKIMKKEIKGDKQKEKTKSKGSDDKKKSVEFKIKINLWKVIIAVLIFVFFAPFLLSAFEIANSTQKLDISQAMTDIKDNKVKEVVVQNTKLVLTYQDGTIKTTTMEKTDTLSGLLEKIGKSPSDIKYTVIDQSLSESLGGILGILIPIVITGILFFVILRAQNRSAQDIFSF